MSKYVFYCEDCKQEFDQTLHMADVDKGGITCPKCGGMIYFDIAHWDTCTEIADPEAAQPAVLVGGRFSVGTKATPRRA